MKIRYQIEIEQDDIPVRGNAIASGDKATDKAVEDEIIERLDNGDTWAWCSVCVVAEAGGTEGRAYLGACSYKDEEDFRSGGYYEQMQEEAKEDLMEQLRRAKKTLEEIEAEA